MKKMTTVFLCLLIAHQVNAYVTIEGGAAKTLYELIPGDPVHVSNLLAPIKQEKPIRDMKFAGHDVQCAYRTDDSYKCRLPGAPKSTKITLKEYSSKIFFKALMRKGESKIMLDDKAQMCCTYAEADSATPQCEITL